MWSGGVWNGPSQGRGGRGEAPPRYHDPRHHHTAYISGLEKLLIQVRETWTMVFVSYSISRKMFISSIQLVLWRQLVLKVTWINSEIIRDAVQMSTKKSLSMVVICARDAARWDHVVKLSFNVSLLQEASFMCSACRGAHYCSNECQKDKWLAHSKLCKSKLP